MGLDQIFLIPGFGRGVLPDPAYRILVKTDNAGTSNSDQFTLPATGTYTVDWGDSAVESKTGAATHTYATAGNYVIRVTGGLQAITFNNGGDKLKLLEIQNWGNIAWTTMAGAYYDCENMQGAFTDKPDLSGVTSMLNMFRDCSIFNHPIGDWDTGNITNMERVFQRTSFNKDIGAWDTGNVVNMAFMFNTTPFNQDIGIWDTKNVENMSGIFSSASSFNQNISGWDVRKVSTFFAFNIGMFQNANAFNQDLGAWQLRLAGVDMSNMFAGTSMTLSVENYSRTLIGWANYVSANSDTPASVTLGAGNRKYNDTAYVSGETYNDAVAARAYLADSPPSWTITDGGEDV
jgi:surface protein